MCCVGRVDRGMNLARRKCENARPSRAAGYKWDWIPLSEQGWRKYEMRARRSLWGGRLLIYEVVGRPLDNLSVNRLCRRNRPRRVLIYSGSPLFAVEANGVDRVTAACEMEESKYRRLKHS